MHFFSKKIWTTKGLRQYFVLVFVSKCTCKLGTALMR